MLSRRTVLSGFGAGLVALLASPAFADQAGAEKFVTGIAEDVMGLANSGAKGTALRGKFSSLLNRYVNLNSIALFALGPYQKSLPADKRAEFFRLFSNYAAALFVYYSNDFKGDKLDIISSTEQGNGFLIQSAITGNGREQIKWRVNSGGGGYRISDINVKGVWLTIATKKRFNDVLKRSDGDFEPLFAELKEAETW